MPRVLARVSLAHSRELFLLTVVTLALGTASVSFLAGLTLAFGAFLAGLLVLESEYAHRTLTEVFPLREVFAVVFFVAVGMLIEPASFVNQPEIVFGAAFLGIIGKLVFGGRDRRSLRLLAEGCPHGGNCSRKHGGVLVRSGQ